MLRQPIESFDGGRFAQRGGLDDLLDVAVERKATSLRFRGKLGFGFGLEFDVDHTV